MISRAVFWYGSLVVGLCAVPTERARGFEPLFSKYGVGTLLNPLERPETIPVPPHIHQNLHLSKKDNIHIFGVNGLNPMCLGNFNGMCEFIREQGFPNVRFGQLYTAQEFFGDIRQIRKKDPTAKIVLIGYSFGADYVEAMANKFNKEGIAIDMVVYLVGDLIRDGEYSRPPNVGRIVNVRARGALLFGGLIDGEELTGARNYKIDSRHIKVPSRAQTLSAVTGELIQLSVESYIPKP
jgi:hypothetical protein